MSRPTIIKLGYGQVVVTRGRYVGFGAVYEAAISSR